MLLPMNDVVSSISSQIVEQIEAIPEAVLSKVSKLIDSVMSKRQGDQRKQFTWEKETPQNRNENELTINKHPEICYKLMDCVMK